MPRTKIEYAGDFEILECRLYTSEGVEIPLSGDILSLDLFEDIENSSMSGELIIKDSGNIQQVGPLIGQEYLGLHVGVPTMHGTFDYRQDYMHVTAFVAREDVNKQQIHTVKFVSREFVKNYRTTVSQSLTGSNSGIVTDMMKGYIKTNKDLHMEPTSGIRKIVSPDISPFDVIDICKREAISTEHNSSTFFFYENKEGYHFRSLESMYADIPSGMNYTYYVGTLEDCGPQLEEQYNQMLHYEFAYDEDTIVGQQTGQFCSKTIVHDIYNKKYHISTYNYHEQFENEQHMNSFAGLEENPLFNSLDVDMDEHTISDFPTKTYLMPVSRKYPYDNVDGSHSLGGLPSVSTSKPEQVMGQRTSRMANIRGGKGMVISVYGNPSVSAGSMVNLNIPYVSGAVKVDDRQVDRFANGPHLVTSIRHNFNNDASKPTYKMHLTCVKDCMEEELRTDGRPDRGQYRQPEIYSEFYEEETDI